MKGFFTNSSKMVSYKRLPSDWPWYGGMMRNCEMRSLDGVSRRSSLSVKRKVSGSCVRRGGVYFSASPLLLLAGEGSCFVARAISKVGKTQARYDVEKPASVYGESDASVK